MQANETALDAIRPEFIDVAQESGIRFRYENDAVPGRYFLPEVMGGGVGWLDYDSDGRLDLYATNGCPLVVTSEDITRVAEDAPAGNGLFRQVNEGRFVEVAALAGATSGGYGQGIAVGDFDADGFPDLFLANYGADNLLRNNGDGTFTDMTEWAGVGDERWGSSCLWLDLDGDRLLDLYVVNYMNVTPETHGLCEYDGKPGYCGPGRFDGVPDGVYLNVGDGTFVAADSEFGFGGHAGKGLAIVAFDVDGDLVPEIYVGNDMEANFLFVREPAQSGESWRYRERAREAGCAVGGDGMNEASMGIACGDFDGDGRPDLFLTHYYHAKNTLYRNLGGLLFQDQSRLAGVAAATYETLGFGTVPIDFDHDGDLDLFMANGHVLGAEQQPNAMRPQLLENDGRGRFRDVSPNLNGYFAQRMLGRGVAAADYDGDGDLDIAVSHLDRPLALLRNETASVGRSIGLELVARDRVPPIGARIRITSGGRTSTHTVSGGGSYLSACDTRLLFGIGTSSDPVTVEVVWPSGAMTRHEEVPRVPYWRIEETSLGEEARLGDVRRRDEL